MKAGGYELPYRVDLPVLERYQGLELRYYATVKDSGERLPVGDGSIPVGEVIIRGDWLPDPCEALCAPEVLEDEHEEPDHP